MREKSKPLEWNVFQGIVPDMTLEQLRKLETVLIKWTEKSPVSKHFGVPCGFFKDDYKKNKRTLNKVRRKIEAALALAGGASE
jgi:hypothetical protein